MTVVSAKTPAERACALDLAVRVLRAGGVIAYPTETVYGLGCDPRNAKSLARIFRIKGREKRKPVLLVASGIAQVKNVARLSPSARRFVLKYWPGPLTVLLPSKRDLMGREDVAIRVSSNAFVRALASRFGFPIVSTSANRSGSPPCRSIRAIIKAFAGREMPDLLIDAGALPGRTPSTIIRLQGRRIQVVRQGSTRLTNARISGSTQGRLGRQMRKVRKK